MGEEVLRDKFWGIRYGDKVKDDVWKVRCVEMRCGGVRCGGMRCRQMRCVKMRRRSMMC